MPKKVLPLAKLQELIQQLVDDHENFKDAVRVLTPQWHERDAEGCNWDVTYWSGGAELARNCRDTIEEDVRHLRRTFDAPDRD